MSEINDLRDDSARADLLLDRESEGMWAPGPNAHWKLISDAVGKGKGFTRAALHRHLISHHEAVHGGDTHATSAEFENAGRGTAQTVFHKRLPGEVKRYLEGNPAARHIFRVTNDAAHAGGEDALHDLGDDKYFAHVDRLHGSTLNAALETARHSDDPEVRFTATLHDHMPDGKGRKNIANVPAGKLKVGQRFTFGGIPMRVVEDEHGHKVVAGMGDDVPLDALKQVPVDRGSLKAARSRKPVPDDIAPFSAASDGQWLCNPYARTLELSATKERPPIVGWELGHPVYEVWSDSLICGDYTHPISHQNFSITRGILDQSANSLSRMLDAGVDVPIVQDHAEKSAKALGWVRGAKRDGDRLKVKHHLIGDDALLMAARNKVSVKLVSSFRDSRNQSYPYAITHSSLTPIPVVPGQAGFSIAASGAQPANLADGTPSVPVFLLSAAPHPERKEPMPVSAELLSRFKNLPGTPEAKDDATAEDILTLALSYAETAGSELVRLNDENTVLLSRAETAEGNALELSRAEPKHADPYAHLDPEALADRADLTLSRIDLAIERGDMPKAIADKVRGWVKRDGKPNAMLLSRAAAFDARPIDAILSLFDGARLAPRTGEVSGTQLLARVTPGESPSEDLPYKRMAERYNATAPAAK